MGETWLKREGEDPGELTFLTCGAKRCLPGELAGPALREHYMLHVCLSGRGVFQTQDKGYDIGPGEAFLMLPGEVSAYRADEEDPWHNIWVGFTGRRAEEYLQSCGLNDQRRVCHCDQLEELEACVEEMRRFETAGRGCELLLQGGLYRFLGWVAMSGKDRSRRGRDSGGEYVRQAVEYIRSHFQEDLTVARLAKYVGLNRSYLTTVFQNTLGMSPQQVLMRFRMERAAQLLEEKNLSVAEIARSCGYLDPLTFSKAFKRTMGVTPSQYRCGSRDGEKASVEA